MVWLKNKGETPRLTGKGCTGSGVSYLYVWRASGEANWKTPVSACHCGKSRNEHHKLRWSESLSPWGDAVTAGSTALEAQSLSTNAKCCYEGEHENEVFSWGRVQACLKIKNECFTPLLLEQGLSDTSGSLYSQLLFLVSCISINTMYLWIHWKTFKKLSKLVNNELSAQKFSTEFRFSEAALLSKFSYFGLTLLVLLAAGWDQRSAGLSSNESEGLK